MGAAANKRLTIGLVLDTSLDPFDGVQQYVVGIGEWLSSQGHQVHYLVGETKRRDLPNIHTLARNIGVRFNGNRTTVPLPANKREIKRLMSEIHFDVLHIQMPHSPYLSQRLILAADKRTAIIGTFHIVPYGWLSELGNRLLGMWLRPSLKRFDKVLSVSSAASDFALSSFGLKSEVLPNIINYRNFNGALPLSEYNDGSLTVLFFGRLVERKGCRVLLQAINKLKDDDSVPKFKTIICGDGHLRNDLMSYVSNNGLSSAVSFKGFVTEEEKPRYYASADLSVFPSSGGESFGIVLLEAMASGHSAVLAGDNPGYSSVMSPRPETLFPPRDYEALAEKIKLFLKDKELRQKTALWGEAYAKTFDVNTVGQQLIKIYNEILLKKANQ